MRPRNRTNESIERAEGPTGRSDPSVYHSNNPYSQKNENDPYKKGAVLTMYRLCDRVYVTGRKGWITKQLHLRPNSAENPDKKYRQASDGRYHEGCTRTRSPW